MVVENGVENTEKMKNAILFCKKCNKEVIPIEDKRTYGKAVANFLGFIAGAGSVYAYHKRCPYCRNVLRTKTQKTCCIIFLVIWITIVIIGTIIIGNEIL